MKKVDYRIAIKWTCPECGIVNYKSYPKQRMETVKCNCCKDSFVLSGLDPFAYRDDHSEGKSCES